MKNWKGKPPLVLISQNGIPFSIGQNITWKTVQKSTIQNRRGVVKKIYPDGALLVLGRRGKTRLDPRHVEIEVSSNQSPRFLHGDKIIHTMKGYGIFIKFENETRQQCFASFGSQEVVRQTDRGELVQTRDLKTYTAESQT